MSNNIFIIQKLYKRELFNSAKNTLYIFFFTQYNCQYLYFRKVLTFRGPWYFKSTASNNLNFTHCFIPQTFSPPLTCSGVSLLMKELLKRSLSFHFRNYRQRHINSHVLKPPRWIVIPSPVCTTTPPAPIFCLLHARIIRTPMTEPMTPQGHIIPNPAVHPHMTSNFDLDHKTDAHRFFLPACWEDMLCKTKSSLYVNMQETRWKHLSALWRRTCHRCIKGEVHAIMCRWLTLMSE